MILYRIMDFQQNYSANYIILLEQKYGNLQFIFSYNLKLNSNYMVTPYL